MHYRIFSILVTAFLLISCLPTAFAQDNQSEKPVVLYGTPKKYEIAEQEYLSMLEELFRQEMEEDEELIRDSDDGYVIVEYDK